MPLLTPGRTLRKPLKKEVEALARVLARGELEVVFQPIFNVREGNAFGYEALARSPTPIFEGPLEMFSVAAASGQVGELGRLQRVISAKQAPRGPLFLNVHPAEFDHPLLIKPDDPIFRHTGDIYLEITESAPLRYFEQCTHVLGELRQKGVRLAIDDFGAGYSNVKYISDLAPDIVKLDRELIAGVREGTRQFKLLQSVVRLCREMGAQVVAEGVETTPELVIAVRAEVDFCQGFLLGTPASDPNTDTWPGFT